MHLKFGEKNTPEFEVWRLYEEFAQISQLFAKHSVITAGRGDDFRKFHGCLQNIKSRHGRRSNFCKFHSHLQSIKFGHGVQGAKPPCK